MTPGPLGRRFTIVHPQTGHFIRSMQDEQGTLSVVGIQQPSELFPVKVEFSYKSLYNRVGWFYFGGEAS